MICLGEAHGATTTTTSTLNAAGNTRKLEKYTRTKGSLLPKTQKKAVAAGKKNDRGIVPAAG
jgi:hypothetical protein